MYSQFGVSVLYSCAGKVVRGPQFLFRCFFHLPFSKTQIINIVQEVYLKAVFFLVIGQASGGYTGDYIIGSASVALTKLRHNRVMQIMSRILEDLVQGW